MHIVFLRAIPTAVFNSNGKYSQSPNCKQMTLAETESVTASRNSRNDGPTKLSELRSAVVAAILLHEARTANGCVVVAGPQRSQ